MSFNVELHAHGRNINVKLHKYLSAIVLGAIDSKLPLFTLHAGWNHVCTCGDSAVEISMGEDVAIQVYRKMHHPSPHFRRAGKCFTFVLWAIKRSVDNSLSRLWAGPDGS